MFISIKQLRKFVFCFLFIEWLRMGWTHIMEKKLRQEVCWCRRMLHMFQYFSYKHISNTKIIVSYMSQEISYFMPGKFLVSLIFNKISYD